MQFSDRILREKPSPTLEISALANALKAKGVDVIAFSTGEPDFDTPRFIKDAAIRAIESGKTKYTAVGGIIELKKAIVEKFKRDNQLEYKTSEVTVNCGGKHSFYNLMQVLLNPGDEVIVPAPYWVSYPPMVSLAEGTPIIIQGEEAHDYKITPEQLQQYITPKTRAIVINSPSNPSGSTYSKEELLALGNVLKNHDILIICDDIYESIVYDEMKFYNLAMLDKDLKDKCVILNGVSKAYSMPGWRIGYMAGNAELIEKVEILQSQSTSNPTSISQWAAVEALLGEQDVIKEMVVAFDRRRKIIISELNKVPGFRCAMPTGAFYAFPNIEDVTKMSGFDKLKKYNSPYLSSLVTAYLLEEAHVAVVPGFSFGTDKNIRLSFATSDENIIEGCKRIQEAMQKLV